VQTVGATGASAVRLKVCVARETDESALGAPVIAERFGVICVVFRAEGGGAQPVVTGSAVGSRWWSVASDRRFVMRLAPSVARGTSVFARAGRSR
jgi:hypothetical protein